MFPRPTDRRSRAFVRGFLRGLASPLVIYSSIQIPPYAEPMEFKPLPVRGKGTMADDWKRVGQHIRDASNLIGNG